MQFTVLVDNRLEKPLRREHGFSLLIETDGKRILFDTGLAQALFVNAVQLNVSLENLDCIILSHGHYDHGGNLAKVLKLNPNCKVIAHPDVVKERYSLHKNSPIKSTALDVKNRKALLNHKNIVWSSGVTEVVDGIFVTGEIPRINDFEDAGGPFFLDREGRIVDTIPDDMALWIDEGEYLTVICGCCHAGLINTLSYIEEQSGRRIRKVLGGFHLLHAPLHRLEKTIAFLKERDIEELIPLHCTGSRAIRMFSEM